MVCRGAVGSGLAGQPRRVLAGRVLTGQGRLILDDEFLMASEEEQFEWDAFIRDTNELSLAGVGAWLKCLYKMRLSVTRGRITMPIEGYARMFGSLIEQAERVVDEISMFGVGDCERHDNGNITLTNRRMYRIWSAKEANRIRQLRWQKEHRTDEPSKNNASITKKYQTSPIYKSKSSSDSSLDLDTKKLKLNIEEVFNYWRATLNHPKALLTKERSRCIAERLREGYIVFDLKRAVDGCKASAFHMGTNDEGKVFDDVDLIFRNGAKVEKFIGYLTKQNGKTKSNNGKRTDQDTIAESADFYANYPES